MKVSLYTGRRLPEPKKRVIKKHKKLSVKEALKALPKKQAK